MIQKHREEEYSNRAYIEKFLLHIDEFENTRGDGIKIRQVIFPPEVNSMFGITPVEENIIPIVSSLECLIKKLKEESKFNSISLGIENPYIEIISDRKIERIYLKDAPRLRQLYNDYHCFRKDDLRMEGLNFILSIIKSKGLKFKFIDDANLREIALNNKIIYFVYQYTLNKEYIQRICPNANTIIVNLHNWNDDCNITEEAYDLAESINVTLMGQREFIKYVTQLR